MTGSLGERGAGLLVDGKTLSWEGEVPDEARARTQVEGGMGICSSVLTKDGVCQMDVARIPRSD